MPGKGGKSQHSSWKLCEEVGFGCLQECACTMDMLVSSALEADSSLPSFFEMFMTQQVEQSLKPAARHAHR